MVVSQGNHVQDAATGEAVANYLKAVGLKVTLKVLGDQPAYVELMRRREHNAAFIAWSPGPSIPTRSCGACCGARTRASRGTSAPSRTTPWTR